MLLSLLNSHSSCTSEHSGPCMNECAPNLKASVSLTLLPNVPLMGKVPLDRRGRGRDVCASRPAPGPCFACCAPAVVAVRNSSDRVGCLVSNPVRRAAPLVAGQV
jgi:hypothetical protein